jgi:hypothetical protein
MNRFRFFMLLPAALTIVSLAVPLSAASTPNPDNGSIGITTSQASTGGDFAVPTSPPPDDGDFVSPTSPPPDDGDFVSPTSPPPDDGD